jgi:spoIIIJ-associated protein
MNFFKKLFGSGKKDADSPVEAILRQTVEGLIANGGFEIEYEIKVEQAEGDGGFTYDVQLSGPDEELFKDRKGQLLDAFQLLLKRVVQHHFPEDRSNVLIDCGGYREESEAALIDRADKLKAIAIEQNKAVYYRALPPKERKVVHQYLSKDLRVKSRSLGEGLYKKIKIYPAKNENAVDSDTVLAD